jgi:hypothetical protein
VTRGCPDVRPDGVRECGQESRSVALEPARSLDSGHLNPIQSVIVETDSAPARRIQASGSAASRCPRAHVAPGEECGRQVKDRGEVAVTLALCGLRVAGRQETSGHRVEIEHSFGPFGGMGFGRPVGRLRPEYTLLAACV